MYLYQKCSLPKSFRISNYWILNEDRNVPYTLRIQEDYQIPYYRLAIVSRLSLISLPKAWNAISLPDEIKSKPTYQLLRSI